MTSLIGRLLAKFKESPPSVAPDPESSSTVIAGIRAIDGRFYDADGHELCPACLDVLPCVCTCSDELKRQVKEFRLAIAAKIDILDDIMARRSRDR